MRTPQIAPGMFAAVAIFVAMSGTAGATVLAPEGGRGDQHTELRCPANHFLVGVQGRTGSWIDRIALMCRKLTGPDYTSGSQMITSAVGGSGGSPTETSCALGSAVRRVGFLLYLDDHRPKYVAGIVLECNRPRDGSPAGERRFGFNDLSRASMKDMEDWIGMASSARRGVVQTCPGNEYAAGLAVRHGAHVNAVGLICEDFNDPESTARREPVVIRGEIGLKENVGPGMEDDTDRTGADYRRFALSGRTPEACQRACKEDAATCRAWTYVRPGVQGSQAICYLKKEMPAATANTCCISGIERPIRGLGKKPSSSATTPSAGPAASVGVPPPVLIPLDEIAPGMENNTDRPGRDIARFTTELPTYSTPIRSGSGVVSTMASGQAGCQSACQGTPNCAAWTYVRKGVQGPDAVCYLKSEGTSKVSNECCISGVRAPPRASPSTQIDRNVLKEP
jgi:hypothetical protein